MKNIGRTVVIKFNDGSKKEGKLIAATDSAVTIEETVKEKGKKALQVENQYTFDQITEIKVTVSFK
ncbi:hypothetical protein D3C80_498020 [compost metagenome]